MNWKQRLKYKGVINMSELKEVKRTPEEELQIEYSQNAYQAGDISYRLKCFKEELEATHKKMAEINQKMVELTAKKEAAKPVDAEVVNH